ncbi:MAG: histidine--tRNA ligase [SAR324 cluster bacterium]|uniref:Histidine--tRNA ligase n=1 Tax=SAR324 cluster bacterium TaxID=2024889 RepID=A0A2A4T463_9DELT|nr:MAG: histidine--tRNA ligase [SAR324 cluster bacterium]
MQLKIVKGTRDLYDDEVSRFQFLEEKAKDVFKLYGFKEIRTPIMEKTELFTKGVGEDTDIVGKEMYQLEDRRGQSLVLRPEGTAPVVRHVITNNLMAKNRQLRYYYMGPMFRFERPQKGRYRQFHQIGAEFFGVPTADADLEMFLLLRQYFKEINLTDVSFQLNSIGCNHEDCRPTFKKELVEFLESHEDRLCENCLRRTKSNPLRVLDCKVPLCIEVTEEAPKIYEHICGECDDHFEELKELLALHDVQYELNAKLVRGLDYYTRTVFEVYSANLGAQSAAGGGGRYDGLFDLLGAEPVSSIGFALGLDRLAMLTELPETESHGVFVLGHDRKAVSQLVALCRESGQVTHFDPSQASMKSQFRQANKLDVKYVLVLGEKEIESGQVTVKNMLTSEQSTVNIKDVKSFI